MSEENYKNLATKKRRILGPFGRLLMKLFRWEIKGEIPDLSKMILIGFCLLYTSPSPRDSRKSRMPSSA